MEKLKIDKQMFRELSFTEPLIDVEKRTVTFPFSSELPVERYFGGEILDHSAGSMDLSRLNNAGALLLNHDTSEQIGVIEKAWLNESERRCYCTVRFSKQEDGEEIFQDVIDKIRRNVSFGYMPDGDSCEVEPGSTPEKQVYRFTKWMPYEVSIVSVPADASVGIGRAADVNPAQVEAVEVPKAEVVEHIEVRNEQKPINKEKLKMENEVKEISAIGAQFGMEKEALQAIGNGVSLADFQKSCMDALNKRSTPAPLPTIGLDKQEVKRYSIMKVLRALANPGDARAQDDAKFEREVSAECQRKLGVDPLGIFVPHGVLGEKREFNSSTGAGSNLIATNLLAGSFIEKLENLMVVRQLGAQILSGLVGNVAIPKQTGGATAYWIATNAAITAASNPTIAQVSLTPKTIGAYTDIGRDLLKQSSLSVESMVMNDLAERLALSIDLAALKGSAQSNQPRGIYNAVGVGTVSISGVNPTFANMVEFETDVDTANALAGNLAYVMNSAMRGKLKTTPIESGYPTMIMGADGMVNGYKTAVTNQLAAGEIIFGNFADVLIGLWGGLDLTADPYTLGTSGALRVTALQTVDVAVRRAESFSTAVAAQS
jgi:HK97 family phage major capsid protein